MSGARPVTADVDWAKDSHAVCVVDGDGEPLQRLVIPHSKARIGRLLVVLQRHAVAGVGIERPAGPLVAALLAAGAEVFVVAPAARVHTAISQSRSKTYSINRRCRYPTPPDRPQTFPSTTLDNCSRLVYEPM